MKENGGQAPYGGYVAVYPRSVEDAGAEPEPETPGEDAIGMKYLDPALAAETIETVTNGEVAVKSIYGTEEEPAENIQAPFRRRHPL